MKILIFGASGSGTTTLAQHLAEEWGYVHLDVDDFYWVKTDPPFREKQPKEVRKMNLKNEFESHQRVVVSGSLVSWGSYWPSAFDLAVFLYLSPDIRISRLQQREFARYGRVIYDDPKRAQHYQDFMAWAKRYDEPAFAGRSLVLHKAWMETLTCPTLDIEGDLSVEERIFRIENYVQDKGLR